MPGLPSIAACRCTSAIPQSLAGGTNENTNGPLRQYFRSRSDFAAVSREELNVVAAQLNGRPRKTLGWMTPAERFADLLAQPHEHS